MNTKKDHQDILNQVVTRLCELDVQKILLFGSFAANRKNEDSDIDLLVVLDDHFLPQTYKEWMERKLKVRKALREINNEIAIDVLVYTIPQYEIVKENMNSFQREIHQNGTVLYEKAS